jgi:hypothetical protein
MNLIVSMHSSEIVCEPLQVCNENIMCMRTNNLFGLIEVEITRRRGLSMEVCKSIRKTNAC